MDESDLNQLLKVASLHPHDRDWDAGFEKWDRQYRALGLHDAHVRAGPRRRGQLLNMAFYCQIYSVPLIRPEGVMGIPPKVNYGRDTSIIRDDRSGEEH